MKTCVKCKHYQEPDGKHPQTTWCGNSKSERFGGTVYKSDTCKAFKSKRKKDKTDVSKPVRQNK